MHACSIPDSISYHIKPSTMMHTLTQYHKVLHNSATNSMTAPGTRYFRPFSQGILLVLLMSGLLYTVRQFVFYAIDFSLKGTHKTTLNCTYYTFFTLLPVTGWVAESWLRRYRAILVGLILSAVTLVVLQVVFVLLQLD